eukprot:gene5829-biopygen16306
MTGMGIPSGAHPRPASGPRPLLFLPGRLQQSTGWNVIDGQLRSAPGISRPALGLHRPCLARKGYHRAVSPGAPQGSCGRARRRAPRGGWEQPRRARATFARLGAEGRGPHDAVGAPAWAASPIATYSYLRGSPSAARVVRLGPAGRHPHRSTAMVMVRAMVTSMVIVMVVVMAMGMAMAMVMVMVMVMVMANGQGHGHDHGHGHGHGHMIRPSSSHPCLVPSAQRSAPHPPRRTRCPGITGRA